MQVFFADDSTQRAKRPKMGKVLSFGGVFVDINTLKALSDELEGIADRYGLPLWTELKWSPRRTDWIYARLTGSARTDCFSELVESASKNGVRALVVSWALGRSDLTRDQAASKVLDYVFERVSLHLNSIDDFGLLVCDRPGGGRKEEDWFLMHFRVRTQFGSGLVRSERILLNALTTDSKMVRLLQLADIVVGATTAMIGGLYDYAPPVFERIRPMFISNSTGQIGGSGLKIAPERMENLYYWLLGEEEYRAPAARRMIQLPHSDLPYSHDESKEH
jgi:hypothetical protein